MARNKPKTSGNMDFKSLDVNLYFDQRTVGAH